MKPYLLLLVFLLSSMANAASVLERAGSVFYVGEDGSSRKLTDLHTDTRPILSPDGKTTAFLRMKEHQTASNESANEIWLTDIAGKDTRQLLEMRPDDDPGKNLAQFNSLAFSADGKQLYFLTAAWATSNALHVLDLTSGKEHFVTDANDVLVIRKGRYANHLVVMKHKYLKQGGSYDYYWLITPEGKEMIMAGENKQQAERFILRQQGKH